MIPITLSKISKSYSGNPEKVLNSIDMDISAGELFFLLGPSGCGKSTLLRIVAGLIEPSSGTVKFADKDVTNLPTEKRNSAMVFQNYALWPHMTVEENVKFGLALRKIPTEKAKKLASNALEMTGMKEYSDRRPGELSGGQQQRVALARAIVVRPNVLLLDEPLSNLDAKLRTTMRREIRNICKESGLTTIYVTHDQKEALAMADRMAILHEGKLKQIGTPREIYNKPNSVFVASFIGEGNFIPTKIVGKDGKNLITESTLGRIAGTADDPAKFANGDAATLLIRPESLSIEKMKAHNSFPARIASGIFLGEFTQWTFIVGKLSILVFEQNAPERKDGEEYHLSASPDKIVVLPSQ
ncbi:MAG TPA: ABC transporter ATP-binding protein [Victivallales bacterium]|nr:ABC transporter ATP-binding protein [Victivallales bacterium]